MSSGIVLSDETAFRNVGGHAIGKTNLPDKVSGSRRHSGFVVKEAFDNAVVLCDVTQRFSNCGSLTRGGRRETAVVHGSAKGVRGSIELYCRYSMSK